MRICVLGQALARAQVIIMMNYQPHSGKEAEPLATLTNDQQTLNFNFNFHMCALSGQAQPLQ